MLIYVAGPLSGIDGHIGTISNVQRAVDVAELIYSRGHHVFVPHLSVFYHLLARKSNPAYKPTYERWLAYDFMIIDICEALFYIASSPGADKELEYARNIGKLVYFDVNEIPAI